MYAALTQCSKNWKKCSLWIASNAKIKVFKIFFWQSGSEQKRNNLKMLILALEVIMQHPCLHTSYPNSKSKNFFQLSGIHHRLRKWVQMMILTRIWIWPIGLISLETAVSGTGWSRFRAASTRNCRLQGH